LSNEGGLVDHLGIDRFSVIGTCFGGPYVRGLIAAAQARVTSAVIFQPIGHRLTASPWRGDP